MSRGMICSIVLHVTMIIVIVFGLPSFSRKVLMEEQAIIVEVLPIKEFTNIQPKVKKSKPKQEPPKQEDKPKPPPKQALPDPAEKPAPPEPKKAEPVPEPVKKEEPKKEVVEKKPEPVVKPKQEKKEEPKKAEEKKPEKPKKDFAAVKDLLADLEKENKKDEKKPKFDDIASSVLKEEDEQESVNYRPGEPLAMSEKDAIKKQISDNWTVMSGAKGANEMIVSLRIMVARDGTVQEVKPEDTFRYNTDSFYRAMVDSGIRAALKASPLKGLPPEKYDVKDGWREMVLNFDPSEMLY